MVGLSAARPKKRAKMLCCLYNGAGVAGDSATTNDDRSEDEGDL